MSSKIHDSDCATNNAGVPELLGPCDCSKGDGLPPRLLGLIEKFKHQVERRAHTLKTHKNYLTIDSQYRRARAALINAIKLWSKRMSSKIEPCPFCGQSDVLVEQLDADASVVICQGIVGEHSACLARGPVGVQDDDNEDQPGKDAAIREWNLRAAPVVERQPVALLSLSPVQLHDKLHRLAKMSAVASTMRYSYLPSGMSDEWQAHAWVIDAMSRALIECDHTHGAPPELADTVDGEVAALKAEIERLKGGQGEPVAWLVQWNSSIPCITGFREVTLKELELSPEAATVTPLFTSQPAPVSVMPDGWKLAPLIPTEAMIQAGIDTPVADTGDDSVDQAEDYRNVYAAMLRAASAVCLDKVKELNK